MEVEVIHMETSSLEGIQVEVLLEDREPQVEEEPFVVAEENQMEGFQVEVDRQKPLEELLVVEEQPC